MYLQFIALMCQRKFYNFCLQLGRIHTFGSPCAINECKLCLLLSWFSILPSRFIWQWCIPCISVWAFQMLLLIACHCSGCLEDLKTLKVILLVTPSSFMVDLMVIIFRDLEMSLPNHCMVWAARNLESFGFLCPELIVPKLTSFSLAIHLGVRDIQGLKTDPFHKDWFIHIGREIKTLCALHSIADNRQWGEMLRVLCFCFMTDSLYLRLKVSLWLRGISSLLGIQCNFSCHS